MPCLIVVKGRLSLTAIGVSGVKRPWGFMSMWLHVLSSLVGRRSRIYPKALYLEFTISQPVGYGILILAVKLYDTHTDCLFNLNPSKEV